MLKTHILTKINILSGKPGGHLMLTKFEMIKSMELFFSVSYIAEGSHWWWSFSMFHKDLGVSINVSL